MLYDRVNFHVLDNVQYHGSKILKLPGNFVYPLITALQMR